MSAAPAETLTGDRTLTAAQLRSYAFWSFDPAGANRALTLPTAASAPGQMVWVTNLTDAAETLTVTADSATVAVVLEGVSAALWSDGVTWRATPPVHQPRTVAAAETLEGTRTLTVAEVKAYYLWTLDPGGAGRNVVMPTEASCTGHEVFIINSADAAEVLTIKASNGSTTICTPTQAECAHLVCNGTTWAGLVGANS
jgi:hypothetical protein